MRTWPQRFSLCIFIVLIGSLFSAAAELELATRAYERKDYATAFKEVGAAAEQRNMEAQFSRARMYLKGEGVLKDPDEAMKWFKAAAVQGHAEAQFFLGAWYLLPHRDVAEGEKWLRLSADQGN